LTTIRAFRAEKEFEEQFDAIQDVHSSSWYLFLATARWLGICVDWFSVVYVGVVTFSFMFFDSQGGAGVGLAVSSAMALTGALQWGVRQSAETENHLVSVERVLEYSHLEPEAALESKPDRKPPKNWPSQGEIRMKNVFLKYDDEAPVLRQISCVIKPKEKIGIVGRTGAGKSSLITALFRIAEPSSGSIEIDGINVLKIGLHDIRSKVSIIPQDPVLFTGTLRRNLDPFGEYNDADMWKVLEEVHLLAPIRELQTGLDTEISEGGSNFSVGQRQLVCLGRAILRRNKILVLDEATANIDHETDALIQKTIRVKFENCTVLTVAHRLHTVMDSDRILVLDAGRIKEFDEPHTLLKDTNSSLYQLVEQTGKDAAATLMHIAASAFEKRNNPSEITSVQEEDGSDGENPAEPLLSQHSV
jgi:ATP-binding cassette subfamily C (CFTR/MRP) protein 4